MLFRRKYLSQQVADRLAAELRRGAWQNNLPSERKLAVFFGVSRKTIRAALAVLARTGTGRSAGNRKVFTGSPKNLPVKTGGKTVVLISSALANRLPNSLGLIQQLDHYFALSGYNLQIELMPARVNSRHWLEKVYGEHRASAWLLSAVTKEVQRWFERRRLPSLIIGSRHEGIHLPDMDIDYRAVCRHAAHTLLRLGHRRIVYFSFDSGFAGDLAGEQGFNEAFSASAPGTATSRIVRHNDNVVQIGHLLNRLFNGRESPTALIVSRVYYTVTVLGHLGLIGKRIPEDVSVICRDYDPMLKYFVPPPAHYCRDNDRFVRRAVQMTIGIDQGIFPRPNSLYFMPQFFPGESLAPAGSKPA